MAIAWRAGAIGSANSSTITLPGTIQAGDVVLVPIWQEVFSGVTYPSGSFASGGPTAPVQVGSDQQWSDGSTLLTDQLWAITAAAGDAGATWTYTFGISSFSSMATAAWSGAAIDVSGFSHTTGSQSSWTAPNVTTTVSGDWWAEIVRHSWTTTASPGTLRYDTANSQDTVAVADSNASAGGSGTVVGGDTWTFNGSGDNAGWTVALKPSGGAAAAAAPQLLVVPSLAAIQAAAW